MKEKDTNSSAPQAVPVDHDQSVREFFNLKDASPATSASAELEKFERELDDMIAGRSSDRANGRYDKETSNKPSMRRRVAVGLAATAAVVSPVGDKAIDTVRDAATSAVNAFSDRLDEDRVFNPDRGNPDNADEIVSSWNEEPSQTTVVIEEPNPTMVNSEEGGPESAQGN